MGVRPEFARKALVSGLLITVTGAFYALVGLLQVKAVENVRVNGRRVDAAIVKKEVVQYHEGKSRERPTGETELYLLHTFLGEWAEGTTPALMRVPRPYFEAAEVGTSKTVVLPPVRSNLRVRTLVFADDESAFVNNWPNVYVGCVIFAAGVVTFLAGTAMGGARRRRPAPVQPPGDKASGG